MSHRCRGLECRKHFSVRNKSVMASSSLNYQQCAVAIYQLTTSLEGVSIIKMHCDWDVNRKFAWHLAHRLHKAWDESSQHLLPLFGTVEVVEIYMGDRRVNMSTAKSMELGGTGCGSVGKAAVDSIKDRNSKIVHVKVVEQNTGAAQQGFVHEPTKAGAKVYTDYYAAYNVQAGLDLLSQLGKSVICGCVRGQAHTNSVDSYWSMLKRVSTAQITT